MTNRIIIVSNSYWNIFNFRLNLILNLKKKYEVILLAPFDKYTLKLKNLGFVCLDIKIDRKGISIINDLKIIYNYYIYFNKLKPFFILSFTVKPNIYASIVSKILKIKIINNVSGLGTVFIKKNLITTIVINLYRFSIKKSHMVFFQNHYDKNEFIKKNITNKNNSFVIPGSGIELDKYKYNKVPNKKTITFLYLGRLIWDKGLSELFEVIKLLKPKYSHIEFNIVGNIDLSNNTYVDQSIINDLIDKKFINFHNFQENSIKFINESDCIVLPSYREGLSRSLLEAASIGRPIITNDVPGCNELVKNNFNGFLCKPRDVNDLYDNIIKFINLNYDQKTKFGLNSRKIAKNYDEKIVIKRYLEVIDER